MGEEARSEISYFCPDRVLNSCPDCTWPLKILQKFVRMADASHFSAKNCRDWQIWPPGAQKTVCSTFFALPALRKCNCSLSEHILQLTE